MNAAHETLLQVRGLSLRAQASGQAIVKGADFDVRPGEFLAIVGESGSGKTMVARAIMGLTPPGVEVSGGQILFDGHDLLQFSPKQLQALRGAQLGMVFQEPMVSLNPAHRIGAQMAEGLKLHTRLTGKEIRQKCIDMLRRVRIEDPERCLEAYPHEFSGGMRQRIMLASVMLLQPRLLIADEPTTALDMLAQREVLDLMVELATQERTAVILITHNLGLVSRYAQRVMVMCRGDVVETGSVRQVLQSPAHEYTRSLLAALPKPWQARPHRACGDVVIRVQDLQVIYPGSRKGLFGRHAPHHVLKQVSLDVHAGETVAVVGGSGSGKTTLGRAILDVVPTSGGRVLYRGVNVGDARGADRHRFRLGCQLVFQDPYSSLDPRMRVHAIVAEPLRLVPDLDAREKKRRTDETLDEVGLLHLAQRWPHELSGGQRQRVAIARALVRRPEFVVADEPVSALDMTIQAQVLALFRDLQAHHGFACMFISHDLMAVEQIAERVVVMEKGSIVEQGPTAQVLVSPRHPYTRALLDAAPAVETGDGALIGGDGKLCLHIAGAYAKGG